MVKPLATTPLLAKVKFPLPLMAPVTVNNAVPELLLLVKVVPPALTAMPPLMVNAELAEFSVIAVTVLSMLLLIVAVPVPEPELVIVPVLLTSAVLIRVVPVLLS